MSEIQSPETSLKIIREVVHRSEPAMPPSAVPDRADQSMAPAFRVPPLDVLDAARQMASATGLQDPNDDPLVAVVTPEWALTQVVRVERAQVIMALLSR